MPQQDDRRRDYRVLTDDGMHPDVAALHLSVQSVEDRLTEVRAAVDELSHLNSPDVMRGVIVAAIREAAADPTVSRLMYDTMTQHAKRSLAQYVGERVITALAVLVLSGGIAWWAYTAGKINP